MVKPNTNTQKMSKKTPNLFKKGSKFLLFFILGILIGSLLLLGSALVIYSFYENTYQNRVYPGVYLEKTAIGGLTESEVKEQLLKRNEDLQKVAITFHFENHIATLSAEQLGLGFDATTSAVQSYSLGRSGEFFSDIYHKYLAFRLGIRLTPLFQWDQELVTETLASLAQHIDIAPENALFEFSEGRVSAFKLAKPGRKLDQAKASADFNQKMRDISQQAVATQNISISLPVLPEMPEITDSSGKDLGIRELIGSGESFFKGSIPGRVHNVALGAARLNGILIPPGEVFSFNQAVGDISAATGYKQAYVIKSGRTVLDDGGGICQVSTTLFRAALDSGLPIVERHAHSYRVGYYEQGGVKPGFDATVYAPSYDLKIENNTEHHILIQAKTDTTNTHLVFEFYGTKDDRTVEISPTRLWDARPAPPDLIQDDPTLPNGQMKQVDWATPGIKAAFDYKVTKNGEKLFEKNFYSNYVPWQAVYLRGVGI